MIGARAVAIELKAREKRTLVGLLGDAVDAETARELVKKYRDSDFAAGDPVDAAAQVRATGRVGADRAAGPAIDDCRADHREADWD